MAPAARVATRAPESRSVSAAHGGHQSLFFRVRLQAQAWSVCCTAVKQMRRLVSRVWFALVFRCQTWAFAPRRHQFRSFVASGFPMFSKPSRPIHQDKGPLRVTGENREVHGFSKWPVGAGIRAWDTGPACTPPILAHATEKRWKQRRETRQRHLQ